MMALDWLASFRLRLLFRGAFLALALAVLAMAVAVLQEEKQRSHDHYRDGAAKTMEQIAARLRHPAGQLALLNPSRGGGATVPGRPVVLPFAALDFDDQNKVRNAVEMSGCLVRYGADASLCTAIGNTPWAGGFIYAAGTFASAPLAAHAIGDERLDGAHRLRVTLDVRGRTVRWLAPFEPNVLQVPGGQRGRFTGYLEREEGNYKGERPVREFRGWVWQASACLDGGTADDCPRKAFFSLRLPVDELRDALFQEAKPAWPPADLDRFRVRIEVLPPGDGPALFDSDAAGAAAPFSLADLSALLLPGETLAIARNDKRIARLEGREEAEPASPLLVRLIGALPVERHDAPVDLADDIATPSGTFHIAFHGDARSVNRTLGAV
ncbi:MAG TPA: sensor histidine kinase, partial [Rhodocyclaceae bacterium]|nr:sensor histidine kinase [Rhodocyclaceae bacterium]